MSISDCEFLVWVAKRLTFKHKDDPAISAKLENIAKALAQRVRRDEYIRKQDYEEINIIFK
jgi:hypothetical protein